MSTIRGEPEGRFAGWLTTIEDTQRWMHPAGLSLSLQKDYGRLETPCLGFCDLFEVFWIVESVRSVPFPNVKRRCDLGDCPTPCRDITRTSTTYRSFSKLVEVLWIVEASSLGP